MKKIILIIILLSCYPLTSCTAYSSKHKEYIKRNSIDLSSGVFDAFQYYNTGFDEYEVYLIGEHHGIKETFEIDFEFTKYLYLTQNVRNVLLEVGYSDAQLLNLYLASGDESILQRIFQAYQGTFAYSQENYEMYQKIYE